MTDSARPSERARAIARASIDAWAQVPEHAAANRGLAPFAVWQALLDAVASDIDRAGLAELDDLREHVDASIRIANEREQPFVEQWRSETGKHDALPDYGDIIHWVIAKNEALVRYRDHSFASPLDDHGCCGLCHQPMDFEAHLVELLLLRNERLASALTSARAALLELRV